jgi:hypothetical protein
MQATAAVLINALRCPPIPSAFAHKLAGAARREPQGWSTAACLRRSPPLEWRLYPPWCRGRDASAVVGTRRVGFESVLHAAQRDPYPLQTY